MIDPVQPTISLSRIYAKLIKKRRCSNRNLIYETFHPLLSIICCNLAGGTFFISAPQSSRSLTNLVRLWPPFLLILFLSFFLFLGSKRVYFATGVALLLLDFVLARKLIQFCEIIFHLMVRQTNKFIASHKPLNVSY